MTIDFPSIHMSMPSQLKPNKVYLHGHSLRPRCYYYRSVMVGPWPCDQFSERSTWSMARYAFICLHDSNSAIVVVIVAVSHETWAQIRRGHFLLPLSNHNSWSCDTTITMAGSYETIKGPSSLQSHQIHTSRVTMLVTITRMSPHTWTWIYII